MQRKLLTTICLLAASACTYAQSFAQTENSWIPDDGSSISFEINVSGLPTVIDGSFGLESVCFNIDHTWDSDLDIRLIAPDGSNFLLVSGVGWGVQNFVNTCFNEDAAQFIYDGTAPYTGTWKPMGDMGVPNNGQNPNGIWKLLVYDTWAFADQGYIYDWSITFGDNPALPFPFASSNLPIVKINTGGQMINNEPKTAAEFFIIDHGPGMTNYVADTDYAYAGNILVELQGFSGPYYPKKNYDIDITDAAGIEIDTVLLGLPSENDFILKAEYLDYSLMKNHIAYTMSRNMGRYAPRTKYCELLVDGEYMGVYSLTEKVKRDDNRVDIASIDSTDISGEELTGGYIIEINENFTPNDWESNYAPINDATCDFPVAYKMVYPRIEEIQPEQLEYIHSYVDSFEDALHGPDFLDSTLGYRQYISVKSFIDFMLVNEFTSNYDSYGRSTFLYKEKNGQLFIGPPWDYDRGYLPWTTTGWVWEITHPMWPFPFWWDKFRDDEEFRNEVYCRWTDLRTDVLSDEAFDELIDSLIANLGPDAPARNFEKWTELGVTDPPYFVEEIRTFLHDRLAWMDDALAPDAVPDPVATFDATLVSGLTYQFTPDEVEGDDYLWDFGDGSTSYEKFPEHTYAVEGPFTVQLNISKYYGCRSSHDESVQIINSITVAGIEHLRIQPNPATTSVTIMHLPAHAQVRIMDMMGRILTPSIQNNVVDVSDLPAGQYTIQAITDTHISSATFIKVDAGEH